jgi:hypothetical protein
LSIGLLVVVVVPKHLQILRVKNFALTSSPPVMTLSTTSKNFVKTVYRPRRCAESSCGLSFTMALLVLEPHAKTSQIPHLSTGEKFPPQLLTPQPMRQPTTTIGILKRVVKVF